MMHLHSRLCEKSALYRRWHDHPSHPFVHWTLFVLAVSLFTYNFTTSVGIGYTQTSSAPAMPPGVIHRPSGVATDHILVKFNTAASVAAQEARVRCRPRCLADRALDDSSQRWR